MTKEEITSFELEVLELLKNVMDPEIEVNIVDLGLIYELKYDGDKTIDIDLTFSTPSCPLGDTIISGVKEAIKQRYPDFTTNVEVVFDPPWSTELVSEDGRRALGM
jgi:metal-sulfur cluster biosynthetic enzyme